jgi:hypothetical protein
MFICLICNKEFKFESGYNRHKNRKIKCSINNTTLECQYCNKNFLRRSHKLDHDKTNKHINNYNKYIQNNVNGDNIAGDKINNILNLTLNINSLKNTNLETVRRTMISDISNNLYLETMENKNINIIEKIKLLFTGLVELLEQIHFNLSFEENHNCKILLIFPGIKKLVYEYLILDINPDTNDIKWNSLIYEDFINEILIQLTKLSKKYIQENFYQNYLDYLYILEKYILKNNESKNELKLYIEQELGNIYINFNKKQKKEEREIKLNFLEKVDEYKEYRTNECKLNNGYVPEIINSKI